MKNINEVRNDSMTKYTINCKFDCSVFGLDCKVGTWVPSVNI